MGEGLQLVVAQFGAQGDVNDRCERHLGASGLDAFGGVLTQAGDVAKTETEGEGAIAAGRGVGC